MPQIGFAYHPSFLQHETGAAHPERPERLTAILSHLQRVGVWDQLTLLTPSPASNETVALVHPAAYVHAIESACAQAPTALDPDTVVSPGSWDAARHAVGAVTLAIDRVCEGALSAAFCAVRPPGHHALADHAMGFCLFNNVAIGARYAQRWHGLQRILIVDWDVHHGNGTQDIFEDDPSVLYFSTHQAPFYPGTGEQEEQGTGRGKDLTINVPLPAGVGDEELVSAFERELMPRAREFQPELVLISAGFDAHRDDPLAELQVTDEGYATLTRMVRSIADQSAHGKIVSVLEGGYNLKALGRSVEAHLRALMDELSVTGGGF